MKELLNILTMIFIKENGIISKKMEKALFILKMENIFESEWENDIIKGNC